MKKLPWILLVIVIFLFYLSLKTDGFKTFINNESTLKKTLETTYNHITELEKNEDWTGLYNYLAPNDKNSTNLNQFINSSQTARKTYNRIYTVNNIEIRGDRGIIDRSLSFCINPDCLNIDRKTITGKKEYILIDNKWYFNLKNNIICDRNEPYPISSEFDRAISLIIQRLLEQNHPITTSRADSFKSIKNCLNIQYASTDDEMKGTEGLFYFSPSSSKEDLRILVSPRYQIKDDLLTAILLSHELIHAYFYTIDGNLFLSCFEDEAQAFRLQLLFMSTLNNEEIASLTYRYNNRTSPESIAALDLPLTIVNYSSVGPSESDPAYNKILNYVKNNSYYQEQCKNQ
ncbi:MAG: hypothetical protein AAB441_02945 [Patescibacteria group bacterium]